MIQARVSTYSQAISFHIKSKNHAIVLEVRLLQAADRFKDQTFFLSQISSQALSKVMFPVGELLKTEVKEMADSLGWSRILNKRESVGVCFVGRRNFQEFISEVSRRLNFYLLYFN